MRRLLGVGLLWAAGAMAAPLPMPSEVPSLPPLPAGGGAGGAPAKVAAVSALHLAGKGAFDLRYVNVGQLVDLLYGEALRVPHVISSEVLEDERLVSFQWNGPKEDLHAFVKVFLDRQGFAVDTQDGVDFISKKPDEQIKPEEHETLVYRPRYRTAAYLAKLLQPLFSGRMAASVPPVATQTSTTGAAAALGASGASAVSLPASAMQAAMRQESSGVSAADELVFSGTPKEMREVRGLLPQLDIAAGEVVVRGWVYEVTTDNEQNSAFSIAANILTGIGGKLSASNGSTDSDPTALRFSSNYLSFAISSLNADTRFKQVSDPHVRVVSGEKVRLNVGSQVPTLGSISYQGTSGTPVQSVEYQDAGLIFDVQPTVMADAIQVKLQEQMSSFVATTTGVNNSPTKNTRQMDTTVAMKDGEVIVLGGLQQDTDSSTTNSLGWLPHFLDGHSGSKGRTEILLVLQVQKV